MVTAVARVRERLWRTAAALDLAGIPYAVAGGNAVAAWVTTVDPSAVRNTPDVDVLVRRSDMNNVRVALATAGWVRTRLHGEDLFLDGSDARPRDAVRFVMAGEKVKPHHFAAAPDVTDSVRLDGLSILSLDALTRMELTTFRRKDRVHLRDILDVGLVDSSWLGRYPPDLAARLQELIDTPDG